MAVLEAHGSDAAAAFLLHDGHEYVMGDIATPVAKALAWYADLNGGKGEVVTRSIAGLKTRLDSVIYEAAGIAWPLPEAVRAVVKQYDARMGRTEQLARMGTRSEAWSTGYEHAIPVSGVDTGYWSAEEAEAKFMLALGLFGLL